MYDVLIVGAGPIGIACAVECSAKNIDYIVIEKGCLVNSIYNYPVNMTFFSTSERLEIGDVPFISHGIKPVRSEALEYYRRVKSTKKLNINLYEKVIAVKGECGNFTVISEKNVYNVKLVIIATGFFDFPNLMDVPGENLPKVKHYFDDPHLYADTNVVVVGGGNSAVDAALETFRKGASVTMVIQKESIDPNIKYWVKPDIENRITDGSINALFKSKIKLIEEESVTVNTPNGEVVIKNDFVLAMTGYHPDFEFLSSCGIQTQNIETNEPYYNPSTFETNVPGIFLAGVVCCGLETRKWFIENSRFHAVNIANHIKKMLKKGFN